MMRIHVVLFIFGMVASTLWGQESAQQQLDSAFQLDWRGQFVEVVEVAKPLTTSAALTRPERGWSWMLVGHAYQQEGRYQDAATAYEQSLRLLDNNQAYAADHADAMSMFATLYRDLGQLKAATRMETRALHFYEGSSDHAGSAIACSTLADLALSQKHIRDGRRYLARALTESKLASGLHDDYQAALSSTQAWLAELDHNPAAAVSGYLHSIAVLEHVHGEQHPQVGWTLMRLGKAYAETGDLIDALDNMRQGLSILGRTVGRDNVSYVAAELAFARALDASGEHSQAHEFKARAESALSNFYRNQCVPCRISLAAFE